MVQGAADATSNPMMKWILIFSGLLLVSIVAYAMWGPEGEQRSRVLDICVEHSEGMSHFHANLFIEINGNTVAIPEAVGVSEDCMSPVHTHDDTGLLHIELPASEQMTITVSDFFLVWGKEFSSTKLMNSEADEENEIVMTVFQTMDDFDARENGEMSADYGSHIFSATDADGDGIPDGNGTVVLIEYKQKSS